jgi:MFS family permease
MEKIREFFSRTFSSLRIRNYRLYFIGQAISLSGTWMQSIGQAFLVLKLTGSGTVLGLVTAAQTLPVLLLGPWGGLIADRYPKRNILYFTQATAGVLALTLGILTATGWVRLWMVYVLAACLGLVNVIDNPTRQTFVMEMVGKGQLTNAVTLNSGEINLARVIGPAIGGGLIAGVGLAPCFIINGLSYIAVLIALFMMRAGELHAAPTTPRAKGQLQEGFRYVWSTPLLRNTLLMMAIVGTLTYEFQVILPLFAQYTFHSGAGGYAALTAAMGVGAVIGSLFTANREETTPTMLIRSAFLFGAVVLLAAVMPGLKLATAAMVLVGFGSITFTSLGNVTLQLGSAPTMRGRVMSLWTVAFLGSTPIGGPIIGWIGEHVGPRWGLTVGGSAAIFAALFGAMTLTKQPEPASPSGKASDVPPVYAEKTGLHTESAEIPGDESEVS